MKNRFLYLLTPSLLCLAGCISHVSVTKVTPENHATVRGERVDLPAPFVVGRPNPDGTVKYTIELFPDPDQEYAIDAWSFMAKQKTDISRTIDMYVQKMSLAQDTTAVAAQLAASAGVVGKSAIDTLVTKDQTQVTAQAAAAKAKADAVSAKNSDVIVKQVAKEKADAAVVAAQESLNQANASGDEATIKAANTALSDKILQQKYAEIDLKMAKAVLSNARNLDQASEETPKAQIIKTPGIVIYRIVESNVPNQVPTLQLEPVDFRLFSMNGKVLKTSGSQLKLETWGKKTEKDSTKTSAGAKPEVTPVKFSIANYEGKLEQSLTFDKDVKKVSKDTTIKDLKDGDASKYVTITFTTTSPRTVKLTFDKSTPSGTYSVNLVAFFDDNLQFSFPIEAKVK